MLTQLLRASIGGAIGVVLVWGMCRLMPRLGAATRAALWWCAAAKFLIALVWIAPMGLPLLPARPAALQFNASQLRQLQPSSSIKTIVVPRADRPVQVSEPTAGGYAMKDVLVVVQKTGNVPAEARWSAMLSKAWPVAVLTIWIAGAALGLGTGARHWWRATALVRRSATASPEILALAERMASRLALSHVPEVRVSDEIDTPLVLGLRRPVMLLPGQTFGRLSELRQRMSICHELAHIKRADLRFGCLPALVEALFFFHPLAKLAGREYALWREAACDAAVLRALDAAPGEYGRMLLDLGVVRPGVGLAASGASWSASALKRRLVMLNDSPASSSASRVLRAMAIGLAVTAMVPMQLVARSSPRWPQITPATLVQKPHQSTSSTGPIRTPPARVPGTPAIADLRFDYVLFHDDQNMTVGTGSGVLHVLQPPDNPAAKRAEDPGPMYREIEAARQFKKPGEPVFWFSRDRHSYVIRDPATIREIDAIWQPLRPIVPGKPGAPFLNISNVRALRSLTEAERATAKRDLDGRLRELDKLMAELTASLHNAKAGEAGDRMHAVGMQLPMLGLVMSQAARQGEADLLKILDRAMATGVATRIRDYTDMPKLVGTVTTDKGAPDPHAAVRLYLADRQSWLDAGQSARVALTAPDGSYSMMLAGLRPGDYFVLAIPRSAARSWVSPDAYGRLPAVATRIHLADSDVTLNLRTVQK